MFVKGLRKFLYAGALLALAPFMARADHQASNNACAPSCAPTTCKVKVCEWVDEPCEYTRTTYKPVTKEEVYTAYRCETVNEAKTCQVTEYQRVCETVNETRCVVKRVPVWEERTEMVTKYRCEKVTEYVNKTVKGGHWECCTVEVGPSFLDRLTSKKHGCGDPCDPCATSCAPCPKTKTVKKWVSTCHTECVPVCRTKMVKECVPVCKKVCTYKCVTETCVVPVQRVKCVPVVKTVTYNVCRQVQVPYQAKRCVTTCVAVNEVVKGTKKVAHWVEKEVPVSPCVDTCATSCCDNNSGGLFSGLRGRMAGFGKKNKGCDTGCGSACGVAASCSTCH